MIKILALTYYFPRISETFVLDQLFFVGQCYDLTIYSLFNPKDKMAREDLEIEKFQHRENRTLFNSVFYEENIHNLKTFRKIIEKKFDLFHFQFGELYSDFYKYVRNNKSVLSLHTAVNLKSLSATLSQNRNSKILLLPTSLYLTKKCATAFPTLNRQNIKTHHLGIDTEKYAPATTVDKKYNDKYRQFTIVLNGRFVGKKGHLTAIKAFNIASQKIPNPKLILIGDGVMRNIILDEIRRLNLESKVVLKGKIPRDEVIRVYKEAHVGIQPSELFDRDEEGLPTSTMEYSSVQLPVIATRHAGIPEVIKHNKTGFLIDQGDFKSLANYLVYLYRNPKVAIRFGVSGRKFMEEYFNMRKKNKELLSIYEQFIKD